MQYKFQNPALTIEERVQDLLHHLTLQEKITQIVHDAPAIERLGIPQYDWWNECLHGVMGEGFATVFPQAIGLAASWNVDLMKKVATAISDEARGRHHEFVRQGNRKRLHGLTFWSPNINIFRDPRWGRGQETYGEDPYLTARMGVVFIQALQGDDPKYLKVVATPKHFAVHSGPEEQRHSFDACVSERDLYETYLPAFKSCIIEAKAASIMGAYNRVNGEPCCASPKLLFDILRQSWQFDGYVVSDCWAIRDIALHHKFKKTFAEAAAIAIKNGCDLNCGYAYRVLGKAVEEKLIEEAEIDKAFKRLFTARFKLGMFDPPEHVPYAQIPPEVIDCPAHRKLAHKAACESIVLLKNENNFLPLAKKDQSIAVIGPNADSKKALLGNYHGSPSEHTTILKGICNKVGDNRVVHAPGCDHLPKVKEDFSQALSLAKEVDTVIVVLGLTAKIEGEEGTSDGDRESIELPEPQQRLLKALYKCNLSMVLVIMSGSAIAFPWAKKHIPAIVYAWYPGEEGGNAVADVLFGDYNPAGRLPITLYKSTKQLPPFTDYSMKKRTYRFFTGEPLYPFGYGLSYTRFAYSNLQVPDKIKIDETFQVSVVVENIGEMDGEEVVQLYIKDVQASVPVPKHHLEGFKRIFLEKKHKKTVVFWVKPSQLVVYNENGAPFVEKGEFSIYVGGQPGQSNFILSSSYTVV